MTDADQTRYSEMQSWRSADGVWIETRWVRPAQVPVLLTVDISGPEYLFYEPIGTCQNGIYVKPWESKTHTAVQQSPTDKKKNSVMQSWPSG